LKIAILLFDRFTALDAVGPYEVLVRIPGAEVTFVATQRGEVRTDTGRFGLTADAALSELTDPDIVVVPGGPGQVQAMADPEILDWLRAVDATTKWTTSVCTGSIILAAAGLLDGKKATTHWIAYDELQKLGVEPTSDRVVFQGKYVTAAGVSSGIDMALRLVAEELGDFVAQAIQLGIEYDPQPPFDAGAPGKAPAEVEGFLRDNSRFLKEGA
jgi:putative intracellular protease/amidase